MVNKRKLIVLCIDEMKRDIDNGDVTAIEVLLRKVPVKDLISYLPDGTELE